MRRTKIINGLLLATALIMATIMPGFAQSSSKSFSTNFTLVNLGASEAVGTISYYTETGGQWKPDETFTLAGNGGQAIKRQYDDTALSNGRGSVVVNASQPVGAVVQIQARGQNPTSSGAYSGVSQGDASFYVPLVARNLSTASGLGNSQIIIQNTASSGDVDVSVELIGAPGLASYTKAISAIKPSASYLYDVATESASNVPDNWYGSAVVRATTSGGQIAVVSDFFTGDALQTFNAFSSTAPGNKWFVPLFTSRLSNSLSTPVAVQNLTGAQIAVDGITLTCTPDPALSGASPFTLKNTATVANNAAYYFNPVTDTSIPANWYGSCIVDAPGNVVSFVQMRFISTGEAAAYEAIKAGGTETKAVVPLVSKRLSNGFATAVTIQNMNTAAGALVTLTYTPSPDYVAGGGSATPIVIPDVTINAGQSLIQNHRLLSGSGAVSQLPNGWYGTLVVTGNQPLAGFVQLTFLRDINSGLASGDLFMAHNSFTAAQ